MSLRDAAYDIQLPPMKHKLGKNKKPSKTALKVGLSIFSLGETKNILFMERQMNFKRCNLRKNRRIPSIMLIFLLLGNTFAFADDEDILTFNSEDLLDLSFIAQSSKNESETISLSNDLNYESQNDSLRSAHKYLGYTTAALAGVTAATSSSAGVHQTAGYITAGLSLITTAIGFYEYGEYFDLDEGFSGYNMHMILETAATVGFMAAAALQSETGPHAVIGGVSTAMMILPIFVVHW